MNNGLLNYDSTFRIYEIPQCKINVTLPDISDVFASHAVSWNIMGREHPWWSVITHSEYMTPTRATKNKFYMSGKKHVEKVLQNLNRSSFETVLDFGCGLGRLAFNFASVSRKVYCVDQSSYHLKIAREQWLNRRLSTQGDINFVTSFTDILAAVKGQKVDMVHSTLVLQHMVAPLQTIFMQQFCDVLKIGGRGWIQIPIKTSSDSCNMEKSMKQGGMQMHWTSIKNIKYAFKTRGCDSIINFAQRKNQKDEYIGAAGTSVVVKFTKSR